MSGRGTPVRRPWLGCEEEERLARAHLSRVVEPGDRRLSRALAGLGWSEVLGALVAGTAPDSWLARQRRLGSTTAELVRVAAAGGVRVVVPGEDDWPEALDDLDAVDQGAPPCLWVRGRLPDRQAVAVVGSRACTPYGEHVTAELAAGLAERGRCVVSGAAYGIDAAAHRSALAASGAGGGPATLAVLACGVDRVYPQGHEALLAGILRRGGGLAAELPPGARPTRWRFLARNRLIAALGAGTVVVEAAVRSGALTTARLAAELGRPVAAVPGLATATTSAGCHELLREGAAVCVCDAGQVDELLGPLDPQASPPSARSGHAERRVVEVLPAGTTVTVDDVVAATGLPRRHVTAALRALAAAGCAHEGPRGWRRAGDAAARAGVLG